MSSKKSVLAYLLPESLGWARQNGIVLVFYETINH